MSGEKVHCVPFFLAIRKHRQLRNMANAIARDPEGLSRIQLETFQQVFDRMEQDMKGKVVEWTDVVEYFTKRGKPLTKYEIEKLQAEDRRIREE